MQTNFELGEIAVVGTPRSTLKRTMASAVALLVAIGVVSALVRVWALFDAGVDYAPLLQLLAEPEARYAQAFHRWLGVYPALTAMHVVPGMVLLALAPFQFSSRIRSRHLNLHRWSGRVISVVALPAGIAGLVLAAMSPFGGVVAASALFLFGTLLFVALTCALLAIRRGDIAQHRAWMIRMFATALGISSIRVIGVLLYLILPDVSPDARMGWTFCLGFVLSVAAGEAWIRYTQRADAAAMLPAPAASL